MKKRFTQAASGRQKRQVRMAQRRAEQQGASKSAARSRAQAKGGNIRQQGSERMVSKSAERERMERQPKRRRGISVRGGNVRLPRRLTSKTEERVTRGNARGERKTKARK
jgi:hypothetical protein